MVKKRKKLTLSSETLRNLNEPDLKQVVGESATVQGTCVHQSLYGLRHRLLGALEGERSPLPPYQLCRTHLDRQLRQRVLDLGVRRQDFRRVQYRLKAQGRLANGRASRAHSGAAPRRSRRWGLHPRRWSPQPRGARSPRPHPQIHGIGWGMARAALPTLKWPGRDAALRARRPQRRRATSRDRRRRAPDPNAPGTSPAQAPRSSGRSRDRARWPSPPRELARSSLLQPAETMRVERFSPSRL
jgi:hypothetical protein